MDFNFEKIKRIMDELQGYIHSERTPVKAYLRKEGSFRGGELPGLDLSKWEPFSQGDRWGGRDCYCWFRTDVQVPVSFDGKTVAYEVNTGREGDWDAINPQFLIYVNGELRQGLDVNHREIILAEKATAGEVYSIALKAYSGMKEGFVELSTFISALEYEVKRLYHNIKVAWEAAGLLDICDKRRVDTINFLDRTINLLDLRKPFSKLFYDSVEEANLYIEKEYYGSGSSSITAFCTGHTHIDVAWLWTLKQTREKTARSFSTVLSLMERYPHYIFMSSQPQLYKFIKEDYPELYEKIKRRMEEKRWEPEGAMWIEPDCNLVSGESFIRQLLLGIRFFEQEFKVRSRILWLPDVFGFSPALPQILKKAGIDYFMTTKLSWNEYNKFPYDTFMWRGIDGSEVFTHFTIHNGAFLAPKALKEVWDSYKQKDLDNNILIPFGYGDGGGGATEEMLENAKRMEGGIPGFPEVRMGSSLEFFKTLEERTAGSEKLPKWVGELYFEMHRGTYTSMARNKRYNRKCEYLYQDAEFVSVMSEALASTEGYPRDVLNRGWETILLNQFHDILPGSSIKEVYEESREQYEGITRDGKGLLKKAAYYIIGNIGLEEDSVIVFNQLSFNRSEPVEIHLPGNSGAVSIVDANGSKQLTQNLQDGAAGHLLFYAENIPAKGYKVFRILKSQAADHTGDGETGVYAGRNNLGNRFFDIQLDDEGHIAGILDKRNGRQVLQKDCKGNVLQVFEDKPRSNDAWDINISYMDKKWEVSGLESFEIVEIGPVRASVRIRRKFLDSVIEQQIRIYRDIPRIDFVNRIDWKEKQLLLKVAFPVDILAEQATYDIQFGNIQRPTHWNTSWDMAKFEVWAHKWADLSEDGYGVSLMNDCKYGYDIKDGIMRLTLLKSATDPNVDADREVHEFTYSLYPHEEGWKQAGTIKESYMLNCPAYAFIDNPHPGRLPKEFSMLSCDRDNVVIETVKMAENSEDVIMRLFESQGRRTRVKVSFFKELDKVCECDLLENETVECKIDCSGFEFEISPYEIKTFRLKA